MTKSKLDDYRNLDIDDSNLDKELELQASKYLYVAEKAVRADMEYELLKAQLSQATAELDSAIRISAEETKRKITEAAIAKKIERNPEHIKAVNTLIALKGKKELARALRESWHMRKDLLIQRAIRERSELDSLTMGIAKAA